MWIQQCVTTTGGVQPCCNSYVDDPLWKDLDFTKGPILLLDVQEGLLLLTIDDMIWP